MDPKNTSNNETTEIGENIELFKILQYNATYDI